MSSIPIDTQAVVDRLTGAGVPEGQAKAYAAVLLDSLARQDAGLNARMCTKSDLAGAIAPVMHAITQLDVKVGFLDAKIDTSVARLKGEVLTWLISLGVLQGGLAVLLKVW